MGDFVAKSLAHGQLPLSKTTLYTVPTGKTAIIRSVLAVNTDTGASHTINLYANFGSGSVRIIPPSLVLSASAKYDDNSAITLEAGHYIEGNASVATTVDFIISGVEG